MPSQSEKGRRKQLLRSVREDSRKTVRDGLPVRVPALKGLFRYIDSQLETAECDDTLRHAKEFTRSHNLPEKAVVSWLENNGGYCDCEAIANAEQVLEEAVPGYDTVIAIE